MMLNFREGSTQSKVFAVLEDKEWHCRSHKYPPGLSGQIAGGGGIQGLQRGTKQRPGLVIESKREHCPNCGRVTLHDRWSGSYRLAVTANSIPPAAARRIRVYYDHTDVIELRQRPESEIVIDHRFPMLRWGGPELKVDYAARDDEMCRHFQLLKKDQAGNHNLLKSRACERCFKDGKRGTPFGINFFYEGGTRWPKDVPIEGPGAEAGCHGCGWYDFASWRLALNRAAGLAEQ
jgi:hypothetical protein